MALYLQKYRSLCILCLFSLIVLLAIYIFLRQSGDLEQSLYPLFGSIVLLFLIVFIRIQDARIFGELSKQVRGGQVLSKTQLDALVQKKARTASLLLELKGIQAFAQGEHEEGIRMLQEAWAKIQDKHGKDWQRIKARIGCYLRLCQMVRGQPLFDQLPLEDRDSKALNGMQDWKMRWENGHDERALWEMQACAEQLREPYLRVYALLICIRSMKQKEQDQAISLCEVLTACQLPDVAHQAACLLEEMKGGAYHD